MSSEAVLECRGVVRRFREGESTLEVLSGVDLSVGSAERVAIIGASGSGKTTLLQIMGGLDDPTSGEVFVGGQSIGLCQENPTTAAHLALARLRWHATGSNLSAIGCQQP